ncbi:MAG: hypothetical protein CMJ81_00950 [Planctomycetaceae bacterium]|nr:hypothetical protein [Planctomycetaceae bacterium]
MPCATCQTSVAELGAACDQSNESRKFNKVCRTERLTRLARQDRFTQPGNHAVFFWQSVGVCIASAWQRVWLREQMQRVCSWLLERVLDSWLIANVFFYGE